MKLPLNLLVRRTEVLRMSGTRAATHAGSWYPDSVSKFGPVVDKWLSESKHEVKARAIIAPHAGSR